MLVYGDWQRQAATSDLLPELSAQASALEVTGPGIARHSGLVGLLIAAGELTQALADDAAQAGVETETEAVRVANQLTFNLATALYRSYCQPQTPRLYLGSSLLATLRGLPLPSRLGLKMPEGYAYYSLYPELYFATSEQLRAERHPCTRVIGIRSIGASLGAAVAAVLGSEPPTTVRPGGHPFQREIKLSSMLADRLLTNQAATNYAIVDEGPGLSGSSFGAAADWLEDRGVAAERLHFFPSHDSPLSIHASDRHRHRWQAARKYVPDFDAMLIQGNPPQMRLSDWVADLTGPLATELEDVGYGQWRAKLYPEARIWPGVNCQQERRKYLLTAQDGRTWLLKFAGLGRYGEEKLERATVLQRAGFIPPTTGLRHGFLVQEWLAAARPLPTVTHYDRSALIAQVASYLAYLVSSFPAPHAWQGATPAQLLHMARHNSEQSIGAEYASLLDRWQGQLPTLQASQRRTATDNKLHAWEWLVLPDGRLLKADALDHHASHDLVGAQDPAWDIAGATVELWLNPTEQAALLHQIGQRAGYRVDAEKLNFYTACYLAFQIGHADMAAAVMGNDLDEAGRLNYARDRYAERLRGLLAGL